MEAVISTPIGNLLVVELDNKLISVGFTEKELSPIHENELLSTTKTQIDEYFARSRKSFDLPLNPSGTDFQKKVWAELSLIPYGKTVSYQQVANRLGDPKSIRAAARANGQNPIAIIIPCHRVIGSGGEMTGYAGGIQRKKDLLTLEGADVMNQMNLF
jgi:methylated-DNA-[protein]-cysteine S-methyltransferase